MLQEEEEYCITIIVVMVTMISPEVTISIWANALHVQTNYEYICLREKEKGETVPLDSS